LPVVKYKVRQRVSGINICCGPGLDLFSKNNFSDVPTPLNVL
jgi:hypothetical protein